MSYKVKKSSPLFKEQGTGLYALEDIFGHSDGHGYGLGQEDISFPLAGKKTLSFCCTGGTSLDISVYDANYSECDIESIGKIVMKKIEKALKIHTRVAQRRTPQQRIKASNT